MVRQLCYEILVLIRSDGYMDRVDRAPGPIAARPAGLFRPLPAPAAQEQNRQLIKV